RYVSDVANPVFVDHLQTRVGGFAARYPDAPTGVFGQRRRMQGCESVRPGEVGEGSMFVATQARLPGAAPDGAAGIQEDWVHVAPVGSLLCRQDPHRLVAHAVEAVVVSGHP